MKPIRLKRCNNCGHLNPSDSKVCNHCTQRFEKNLFEFYISEGPFGNDRFSFVWACPKCDYINAEKNKTCGNCFFQASKGWFS